MVLTERLLTMRRIAVIILVLALGSMVVPGVAGAQSATRTVTVTFTNGYVGHGPLEFVVNGVSLGTVAERASIDTVVPAGPARVDVRVNGTSIGAPFPWDENYASFAGLHVSSVVSVTNIGLGLRTLPLATNAAANLLDRTDGSVQFLNVADLGALDLKVDGVVTTGEGGTPFNPNTSITKNFTGGTTKLVEVFTAGTSTKRYEFTLGPIATGDLMVVTLLSQVTGTDPTHATNLIPLATRYSLIASDGGVFTFGHAQYHGGLGATVLNAPVIAGAATPSGDGYWLVAKDGGVFSFGDAAFYGSTGNLALNSPVITMVATPTGRGYWLLAEDGGVFSFGDAAFYGSTGNLRLNSPVIAGVSTSTGRGYWLVAKDGGVFSFGDAAFYGSTGDLHLNQPVIGIASAPGGLGYFLVASDGGVFTFGSADFYGSAVGQVNHPVVAIATSPDQRGYWVASSRGEVKAFGNADNFGDLATTPLNGAIISIFA